MSQRNNILLAVLGAALMIISWGVQVATWHGHLFDDAFIYLRYAQNFGTCALQWNCEYGRIEGYTSPLYLAALVLVDAVGADLVGGAGWLGVLSWGLALVGFVVTPLRTMPASYAGVVAIAMGLAMSGDQLIAINTASGMEGGFVCATLLLLTHLAERPKTLAVVAPMFAGRTPRAGPCHDRPTAAR